MESRLGRLRVVWANAAATDLVGVATGDDLNREAVHGNAFFLDQLPDWTDVVSSLIDDSPGATGHEPPSGSALEGKSGADELPGDAIPSGEYPWHGAAADALDPTSSGVEVRVAGLGGGVHVVWLRPVTDRERIAEQAQRESEHRFRALAEGAPVGIIASEAGTRLGFVNSFFAQIAGMERSMLLGTRWLKTIYPEDLPGLLETLDRVLAGAAAEATVRMVSVVDTTRLVQIRLSPVVTPRRSAGFIGTVEDITARHAWETQLSYQATHDPLTGLANRRCLVDTLGELLSSRRRRDRETAVMFCDLDGFKQVNDTLGHDAGDRVLIEVAQRLTVTARDHDLVARIAGDEFVVLLTGVSGYVDAETAAVRQMRALAMPFRVADQQLTLSASIGIAMASDFGSAHDMLQAADRGMYQAKRTGKGLYRRALPPTDFLPR